MNAFITLCLFVASVSAQSGSGKSTRYWDCCKPSCSWPGKAAYKGNPVQQCKVDGKTPLTDYNAKNGCESGGTAFMCESQQPWAVNDNLAYGFAAASISGLSESQWCGACYELTFTTTAIAGKKMILQVTNTGSDLGGGHFDIQMPGGGVGIFNGCQAQYNAPADGWGSRYGGVSSQSECAKLPKGLQSGCNFRFTWFKNADNPLHTFKRVKCPAEITAKTACVRGDD